MGNLDQLVTVKLLWELFMQVAPVVHVHIPRDRITQIHNGYAFIQFNEEYDAQYAVNVMNGIKLFGKPLKIRLSNEKGILRPDKAKQIGAKIHISQLEPGVDEKMLYDTFSVFGNIIAPPEIKKDLETGASMGIATLSFDSFVSSDRAIEAMNGEWLGGRKIKVQYARMKGSNESYGSEAQRFLAANDPTQLIAKITKQKKKQKKKQQG